MNNNEYSAMINDIEDAAILFLDIEGRIQHFNKGAELIKGYTAQEIVGESFKILYTQEDQAALLPQKLLVEAKAKGKAHHEGWRVRKDGTRFWGSVAIKAVYNEKNNLIGFSKITQDLTRRKNAEDELRKFNEDLTQTVAKRTKELLNTYENLRILNELTDEMFFLLNNNYNILSFNRPAGSEVMKLKKTPLKINDSILDLIPREQQENFIAGYNTVLSGKRANLEVSFEQPVNELVHLLCKMKPVTNNHDPGVFITVEDITERKKSERKAAFEKNNLDALINNTLDLIWSVDRNYRLITSNQPFAKITKAITGNELTEGCDLLQINFTKDKVEKFKEYYDRAFAGETFTVPEYSSLPEELWTEISFYPIKERDKIVGTACYAHNVTSRKHSEKNLKDSEDTKGLIMNAALDAIICMDLTGRIIFWNPEAERVFGWREQDILGRQLADTIVPQQYHTAHAAGMRHYMKTGEGPMLNKLTEITAKDIKGREFPVELTIVPLEQQGKRLFCAYVRDITERKQAQQKIIKANWLYAFISQINQCIVRAVDETSLYRDACLIAVKYGKFKVAWIGMLNIAQKKVTLVAETAMPPEDLPLFTNVPYMDNGPQDHVVKTGSYFLCNNVDNTEVLLPWRAYANKRGWRSSLVLPIKRSGKVVASLNIMSSEKDFFGKEEIALLEEAAGDISFALDVFEKDKMRIKAEIELINNERRLKQAESIAHFGNWELKLETGAIYWSDETCRIYGMRHGDNNKTMADWLALIHPDDKKAVMETVATASATHDDADFTHRIICPDGTIKYVYSKSQFELDKNGNPVKIHGIVQDITRMKEAEQALIQSKLNLRIIVDLIPQFIFAKNYDGQFIFVNKAFAGLYGITPKELVKRDITEIIPVNNDSSVFINQDQQVIDEGVAREIPEQVFTDHTGQQRIFNTVKVPYTVAGTNEKAVLGIAQDITEQKIADIERSRIIADVIQRNKDLEQFSYIVSHNLRAPVSNILGLASMMNAPEYAAIDKSAITDRLFISVSKLDSVIRDLNQVLQVRYHLNEQKETVCFSEMLYDIRSSISNLFRNEEVNISSDFSAADEMPAIKSYMYSIFFNLIVNSVKYRCPTVKSSINIRSVKENNVLSLIFKDNGRGIDLTNHRDEVFGLYKRFHPNIEGKGMGLFMVKTQVETLGGTISIFSKVNEGTEFTIKFDLQ